MVSYIDGKTEEISLSKKNLQKKNSVTPDMVNAWKETSPPTLLSNYDMKDTYVWTILQMYDKQNMPTQIRKVPRLKVRQSSHNWNGTSKCCLG